MKRFQIKTNRLGTAFLLAGFLLLGACAPAANATIEAEYPYEEELVKLSIIKVGTEIKPNWAFSSFVVTRNLQNIIELTADYNSSVGNPVGPMISTFSLTETDGTTKVQASGNSSNARHWSKRILDLAAEELQK